MVRDVSCDEVRNPFVVTGPSSGRRVIGAPKPYMTPELLIEQVRRRPALWDESLREYHDKHLKKVKWNEVASEFVGGSRKCEVCLGFY